MNQSFLKGFKDMFLKWGGRNNSALANEVLLFFTVFTIFVIPVLPRDYANFLFPFSITIVFFFAVLSLRKKHTFLIGSSVFLILAIWASFFSEIEILKQIFRVLNFIFFIFLVANLIRQVSSTATVTIKVIVDSITGYLLLGFAFSLIVAILSATIPGAYNSNFTGSLGIDSLEPLEDNVYYTFMTFTTTGYGDIAPVHPYSKSLAILISVSGQLYIAVVIAMLVGKYASSLKAGK